VGKAYNKGGIMEVKCWNESCKFNKAESRKCDLNEIDLDSEGMCESCEEE